MRTCHSICHSVSFHLPIYCFHINNHWLLHGYMERTSFGEDCMSMRFTFFLLINQRIHLNRLTSDQVFTMYNETGILQTICSQLQRIQSKQFTPSMSLSADCPSLQIFTSIHSTNLLQNEFARSRTRCHMLNSIHKSTNTTCIHIQLILTQLKLKIL